MAVFKGEGGEVERKPDARCLVQAVQNNSLYDQEWESLMGARSSNEADFKIDKLRRVWRGTEKSHYGEAAIISTLAVVVLLMNKASSQQESLALATRVWEGRNTLRI